MPTVEVPIKALIDNIGKAQSQIELLHEKDHGFITVAVKKQDKWMQYHYSKYELKGVSPTILIFFPIRKDN